MKHCTISHKGKVLVRRAKYCDNFFARALGLMFAPKSSAVLVSPEESIYENSIHMVFVSFPIDVFWVDKNNKIVDIAKKVKPFTLHVHPKKAAKYTVEIPAGKVKLKVGQKLKITPKPI